MSRRSPSGREWLAVVTRQARVAKRKDPSLYAALIWARDAVLDAAADGQIDLSRPVTLHASDSGEVHVTNTENLR